MKNSFVPRKRSGVPHSTRPEVRGVCHVVLRIRRGLPWLRTPKTYRILERAFRAGKEKKGFRLVQYSVQGDHLHLLVETDSKRKLSRAMQGLAIRIAKALNRFWHRRVGSVFAERYFSRFLENYKQIKRALAYVLNNARKHGVWSSSTRPDPYSSGPWFTGWHEALSIRRPLRAPPVARPTDICLDMPGWKNFSLSFVPGPSSWAINTYDADLQI